MTQRGIGAPTFVGVCAFHICQPLSLGDGEADYKLTMDATVWMVGRTHIPLTLYLANIYLPFLSPGFQISLYLYILATIPIGSVPRTVTVLVTTSRCVG